MEEEEEEGGGGWQNCVFALHLETAEI